MTQTRRKALSAIVILASPVAALLTYLICRNHVPARIPDPWDWTGGLLSDGDGIRTSLFLLANLPAWVILGVALVLTAASSGKKRGTILTSAVAGSMGLFFWMKSLLISYGAPNESAVQPRFWQVLLTVIVMGAYGKLLETVLPIPTQPTKVLPASNITLQPGQRVMWFGQAISTWRLWGGLALVLASVPVAVVSPSASIAVVIVAGWLLWGCIAKLRINDRGVAVVSGPLGWSKFSVPLAHVTCASTRNFESLQYGAGKRAAGEGDPRSLLIRPGDAVVIETRDHLPIYVSVDHAEEAANVTNALIDRSQLAPSPPT